MRKILFLSLSIFVFLVFCQSASAIKVSPAYPVKILKPMKFGNIIIEGDVNPEKVNQALDLNVDMGGNADTGVELTNPDVNIKKTVSTCREYLDLKDKKWFSASTVDISMESFFKKSCGLLNLLVLAESSSKSYFSNSILDKEEINAYPAEMLNRAIQIGELIPCEGTKTFKQCARKNHGKVTIENGQINYVDREDMVSFSPILRGDLNHDGLEDVAFSWSHSLVEGSFGYSSMVCLEALDKNKKVVVNDCNFNKSEKPTY